MEAGAIQDDRGVILPVARNEVRGVIRGVIVVSRGVLGATSGSGQCLGVSGLPDSASNLWARRPSSVSRLLS